MGKSINAFPTISHRLLPAFNSSSGIAAASWSISDATFENKDNSAFRGGITNLAEAGTLSMEFSTLTHLTGARDRVCCIITRPHIIQALQRSKVCGNPHLDIRITPLMMTYTLGLHDISNLHTPRSDTTTPVHRLCTPDLRPLLQQHTTLTD